MNRRDPRRVYKESIELSYNELRRKAETLKRYFQDLDYDHKTILFQADNLLTIVENNEGYRQGMIHLDINGYQEYDRMLKTMLEKMSFRNDYESYPAPEMTIPYSSEPHLEAARTTSIPNGVVDISMQNGMLFVVHESREARLEIENAFTERQRNASSAAEQRAAAIKASTTLIVTRAAEQADMNDSAKLYVSGQVIAEFTNVQSEKNFRVAEHGQTPAQRHEPDYVDKTFPNATLPVGEYTATLVSGGSYRNPIRITSEDAQLPGFSEKGIKASWAFLIHSRSKIDDEIPRINASSWGCQIFSDSDKEKLDDILNMLGFKENESFKLIIE